MEAEPEPAASSALRWPDAEWLLWMDRRQCRRMSVPASGAGVSLAGTDELKPNGIGNRVFRQAPPLSFLPTCEWPDRLRYLSDCQPARSRCRGRTTGRPC